MRVDFSLSCEPMQIAVMQYSLLTLKIVALGAGRRLQSGPLRLRISHIEDWQMSLKFENTDSVRLSLLL
ncbi:TPA: hypothetical protein L6B59_08525 [Pseudomonas aeruginosa]|nr:hypothetical protein D8668_01420 [Pseudomonas aeruginosa]EVT88548.1 hypothetical protein Z046_02955 [Pseudomonas aeruginosa VRFPA09]OKR43523.1 hypothetical protein BH595_19665 [Pseudomonas aeruginosa]RIY59452.1 hypothetical protein AXW88_28120 [Pseudomonas aeruginosa]HBP5383317.1 hypothetical protein [Pseudomonas aeruginosa]